MLKIGKYKLNALETGSISLDGGAMFGVVPKVLWDKTDPADEANRILLSMNPLVVKSDKDIFIIDTGIGDKFPAKQMEIFQIDRNNQGLRK